MAVESLCVIGNIHCKCRLSDHFRSVVRIITSPHLEIRPM